MSIRACKLPSERNSACIRPEERAQTSKRRGPSGCGEEQAIVSCARASFTLPKDNPQIFEVDCSLSSSSPSFYSTSGYRKYRMGHLHLTLASLRFRVPQLLTSHSSQILIPTRSIVILTHAQASRRWKCAPPIGYRCPGYQMVTSIRCRAKLTSAVLSVASAIRTFKDNSFSWLG